MLGVAEEKQGKYTLEGVANASSLVKTLHDLLRNPQKISYPVCAEDDVSIERLENKQVVVLRVRAVPRKLRPVFIGGNPYGGTYIRRQSGDYVCSQTEVRRMIREASDEADSAVLSDFDLDDLDRDTLARYRRRFQTQNPVSPFNSYEFILWLRHAHLLPDEDRTWLRSLGEGWTEAEQQTLARASGADTLLTRID